MKNGKNNNKKQHPVKSSDYMATNRHLSVINNYLSLSAGNSQFLVLN